VRQAGSEDVPALVVLNRSVQKLHVAHRPDYFKDADSGSVAEWFSSMLQNPGARVWVGEVGGVPAGYVLMIAHDRPENAFCFGRRFCEIDQIAVSPAFRRRGVARALIERVLNDARLRALGDVEPRGALTATRMKASARLASRRRSLASREKLMNV